jgi:hypothetical protein
VRVNANAKPPQKREQTPSIRGAKPPQTKESHYIGEQNIEQKEQNRARPSPHLTSPPTEGLIKPLPDIRPEEDDGLPAMTPAPKRKSGTGQAEIIDHFKTGFARIHGRRYFDRPVDYAKAVELLRACGGSLDDAKAAVDRFLADDWPRANGHAFALMLGATMLPRYLGPAPPGKNGHRQPRARDADQQEVITRALREFDEESQ